RDLRLVPHRAGLRRRQGPGAGDPPRRAPANVLDNGRVGGRKMGSAANPEPPPDPTPGPLLPRRLPVFLLILAVLGGVAWWWVARPVLRQRDLSRRIVAAIRQMAHKRPADVPRGQWEFLLGWTLQLHANCSGHPGQVALDDLEEFTGEIE